MAQAFLAGLPLVYLANAIRWNASVEATGIQVVGLLI